MAHSQGGLNFRNQFKRIPRFFAVSGGAGVPVANGTGKADGRPARSKCEDAALTGMRPLNGD